MKYNESEIGFVLSSLKFGGGERVALNLAHEFKLRGFRVTFLLLSFEGEFLDEAVKYFSVIDLSCDRTWKLPLKLHSYLRREKPEVLISSFWKLNVCACVARIFYRKFRLLLWEHSPPSRSKNSPTLLYAISASILYRFSSNVIAVSNGVRNDIDSNTFGLRSKLKVIFNPITNPITFTGINPVFKIKRRIVWVGRLDFPKNPNLMLDAFVILNKSQGFTLDFIGDGPLRENLAKKVLDLDLTGVVRFHGFQANPYPLMMQAEILASTSDREGLPTVLIEALYLGLRIVSTDSGDGIHDILLDNIYGTIVQFANPEKFALALSECFVSPFDITLQKRAAMRFSPDIIAEQFLDNLALSH
jgi:glycosyltransferase involved in cell wall biosynthesis